MDTTQPGSRFDRRLEDGDRNVERPVALSFTAQNDAAEKSSRYANTGVVRTSTTRSLPWHYIRGERENTISNGRSKKAAYSGEPKLISGFTLVLARPTNASDSAESQTVEKNRQTDIYCQSHMYVFSGVKFEETGMGS